jgi:hypothetical protein
MFYGLLQQNHQHHSVSYLHLCAHGCSNALLSLLGGILHSCSLSQICYFFQLHNVAHSPYVPLGEMRIGDDKVDVVFHTREKSFALAVAYFK